MTYFDHAVLTVMLVSVFVGLWRGVVSEILGIVAWVLAFMAARAFGDEIALTFLSAITDPVVRILLAWVIIALIVLMLMALLRVAVRGLLSAIGLGITDRLLGVFFGAVRGAAIVLVGVAVAGMTSMPKQVWWKEAYLSPYLENIVEENKHWLPQELSHRIQFKSDTDSI